MSRLCCCISVFFLSTAVGVAGDLIDRLKQYSVESDCFAFPSILHFDLLKQEQSDATIIQTRFLGRQINGGQGKFRLDFLRTTTTGKGETRVFEHFLDLGPKERYYVFHLSGGKLQHVKAEGEKNVIRPSIGAVNPFHFAFAGGRQISSSGANQVENVIARFEDFPNAVNLLRNKGEAAGIAWEIRFNEEVPWQIEKSVIYRLNKGCEEGERIAWRDVQERDVKMNWHVSREVNSKWREIEDEVLPVYVQSFSQYFDCNDLSVTEDFEGVFFDYQLKNVDLKELLSKDRLTEALLEQDFPIRDIEKKSSEEKGRQK